MDRFINGFQQLVTIVCNVFLQFDIVNGLGAEVEVWLWSMKFTKELIVGGFYPQVVRSGV